MEKYLVILSAPSLHLINEAENYIEPYIIEFKKETPWEKIVEYVDERLMRAFSLQYSVELSKVSIYAAAKLKSAS